MPSPMFLREILLSIVFVLPILGLLWKIFQVREKVYDAIQNSDHRIAMIEQRLDNLRDKIDLGLNGNRELIEHKATRLSTTTDKQGDRLDDLEQFLVKTTEFTRRATR